MTEKEKMLAGELYDCGDPELLVLWHKAKDRILNELLGSRGKNLWITAPPFMWTTASTSISATTAKST